MRLPGDTDIDKVYQRIGEFVVCYQWLENKLRQIGWQILDPMKKQWPPKPLRNETNQELIDKVGDLYRNLIDSFDCLNIKDRDDLKRGFTALTAECHLLRRYRNDLLHWATLPPIAALVTF
jgi:hypothetical protein